jgi:8-oxo-dGTP pyrophosphatase MutT (NUDIX family)
VVTEPASSSSSVISSGHLALLHIYRKLPAIVRRVIVRTIAPSFTVGTCCVIERGDGAVLLVRHSYRERWGTPGGLLKRGEDADAAARREVLEEVGLDVVLEGDPAVVVTAEYQRVDLVYRAWLRDPAVFDPTSRSPEIVDAQWFAPDALPELQPETAGAFMALARHPRPAPGTTPVWRAGEGGRADSGDAAS